MINKPINITTICTDCGAVYRDGEWSWAMRPINAAKQTCPACQRISDNQPAGFLTLSGDYFDQHRNEIISLVHKKIEEQSAKHPMKRIIRIEDLDGIFTMTFTDAHLPPKVGEEIMRTYKGKLEVQFPRSTDVVRASWVR